MAQAENSSRNRYESAPHVVPCLRRLTLHKNSSWI
jgi:hypothetical protein